VKTSGPRSLKAYDTSKGTRFGHLQRLDVPCQRGQRPSFPDRREQVTGLVAKNLPNRLECRLVPPGHEEDRAMQSRMDTESGSIA
jgi:hypothetical protein